jgi:hypothetical protein
MKWLLLLALVPIYIVILATVRVLRETDLQARSAGKKISVKETAHAVLISESGGRRTVNARD